MDCKPINETNWYAKQNLIELLKKIKTLSLFQGKKDTDVFEIKKIHWSHNFDENNIYTKRFDIMDHVQPILHFSFSMVMTHDRFHLL